MLLNLFYLPSVPFDEDDRDQSVWFLDHDYLENMYAMFKKVNGMCGLILSDIRPNAVIRLTLDLKILKLKEIIQNFGIVVAAKLVRGKISVLAHTRVSIRFGAGGHLDFATWQS